MNKFELIIGSILCISILFNIGIFLYARAVVVRLLSISEELGDLQEMVDSFAKHLSLVYEMETFYGDQTLHNLLNHAVSFNEQLETFEYVYSLTETEEETYDQEETESEAS
tara:strand:+ start:566 stop:898 length:333 start_codon:yes stop_codon:yes gene_type:complete